VGIDALRAAIEAEGRARVAGILRSAEVEVTRLHREASSDARRRQDEELRDLETELRREANARIAAARAEARSLVLQARDELVGRVFAGARDALSTDVETASARDELVARAEQALEYIPPGQQIVFACSDGAARVLKAALAEREGIRVERDPDLPAGFRASGAEGAVVVDGTPSSLLDANRQALAVEILQQLDAEGGGSVE
jgi:vacuolar-type H+-ATPase subunit E/Vma4